MAQPLTVYSVLTKKIVNGYEIISGAAVNGLL